MVPALNATFNNISVMSRQSVLYLVPILQGEMHRPAVSMSEQLNNLVPSEQFYTYIMAKTCCLSGGDNDEYFISNIVPLVL